jgi:peptidoglycan hydrolase-like protein with peptidoglycan-binding domain
VVSAELTGAAAEPAAREPAGGRVLHLTTPLVAGADVRRAQTLLCRNGYADFGAGMPVDGRFGPMTAAACKRAKFWLGYPPAAVQAGGGCYGDELDAILSGACRLTDPQQALRAQRLNAKPQTPLREKAYAEAIRWLGTKEAPPQSNRVRFSDWYGIVGPWCAMFVSYCYVQAGATSFRQGERYAYCPFVLAGAEAGANGLALTKTPARGDLVLYCWDGSGIPGHIGLFEGWTVQGVSFTAVEGNTALGNDANGGEVMRRQRSQAQVVAFVHVGH